MIIKKYTQDEVNSKFLRACDTFRGKIDSSIYKNYVLVILFVKYISDIYKEHKEKLMEKYDNSEEMVHRQMRYEWFVLDEASAFDDFRNLDLRPPRIIEEDVIGFIRQHFFWDHKYEEAKNNKAEVLIIKYSDKVA